MHNFNLLSDLYPRIYRHVMELLIARQSFIVRGIFMQIHDFYVLRKISIYSKRYNQFISLLIAGSPMECRGSCYITNRRGSADYGPLSRRLSCSRDFDTNIRRTSLCSSNSEQNVFCRSRSNNSIAIMHVPENVMRMPSGPDGTRGFFDRSARITSVEPTH